MLCIFQLRNFQKGRLSSTESTLFAITEKYLLERAEAEMLKQMDSNDGKNHNFNNSDLSNINGDDFIKSTKLQEQFLDSIEVLGGSVVRFWQNM